MYINSITSRQVRVGTLYTVWLTHGHFHWTVKRKYKHFQELHRDLYKHRMMLQLLPLARLVYQSLCANISLHLRVAQSNPSGGLWSGVFIGRIPYIWILKFLSKVCKGQAAAESHVRGNAQPTRDWTNQKDLQQNGIKQIRYAYSIDSTYSEQAFQVQSQLLTNQLYTTKLWPTMAISWNPYSLRQSH